MASINTTTLKVILGSLGYKDIKNLSATSFGVVVAPTKVDKLIPELAQAFKAYKPKIVSDRELRIGDKTIFAKNRSQQRGKAAHSQGRGNEWSFIGNLREWIIDYGKPMTVRFTEAGKVKFTAKRITTVIHTGAVNIFSRHKADAHLITDTKQRIPLSLKDINAGYWESADTYWGAKSKRFLEWALLERHTVLDDNGYGGYSLRPAIAIAANEQETKDVVFGSDIYGRGAVVVNKFTVDNFKWNTKLDCLDISCKEVITTLPDVKGAHEVFFQVRNERSRNSTHLYRGLRTLATMKFKLMGGDKVFSTSERSKIGL